MLAGDAATEPSFLVKRMNEVRQKHGVRHSEPPRVGTQVSGWVGDWVGGTMDGWVGGWVARLVLASKWVAVARPARLTRVGLWAATARPTMPFLCHFWCL